MDQQPTPNESLLRFLERLSRTLRVVSEMSKCDASRHMARDLADQIDETVKFTRAAWGP